MINEELIKIEFEKCVESFKTFSKCKLPKNFNTNQLEIKKYYAFFKGIVRCKFLKKFKGEEGELESYEYFIANMLSKN